MASIAPRIMGSDMALPATRIPETIAHLDIEVVAAALIRNDANVRNTARELDVPSGDFRRLVLADQRLADAALEAIELRLDDAEANLHEALRCGDPRRRDAVSMFMLRNTQRASKRGYATAASAASLEVGLDNRSQPRTIVYRWGGDGSDREMETIERDGKTISVPRYDAGRGGDCLEGEVAPPAVLIEHAAMVAPEPEPVDSSPVETLSIVPEPESAAVRYERERIDAWIRNRLIDYPLASCFLCRKPIIAGQDWKEASNGEARARFHRPCHAEWRTEREAAARQALGLEG
jgi:hypothetical protein